MDGLSWLSVLLAIFFFFCKSVISVAQNTTIDSLQKGLTDSTLTDSVRIEYLNYLSKEYAYISASQAASFAQSALALSLRTSNKRGEAYAYRNLATMYSAQESFYLTLEFIQKAMHLFEQMHDTTGLGNCYMTLGVLYKNNESYSKAIDYHTKSIVIFRHQQLAERLAISLYYLGEAELMTGQLKNAHSHAEEAIRLYHAMYNLRGLMLGYRLKGALYFRENQFKEAEKNFLKVLHLSKSLGKSAIKDVTADAMIHLGRIAHQNHQSSPELTYLKDAFTISKENMYSRSLRTSFHHLSSYYIQKKDFQAAQQLLNEYTTANENLIRWQNQDKAAMVGSVLDALRLSNENQQLMHQHTLKQQVINKQKGQIILGFIVAVLLCVVLGVLLYLYLTRKKMIQTLLQQQKIIHDKSHKLEEINATKDKFFKIIAHDMVSPLNSMSGLITLLTQDLDLFSPEELQTILQEFNKKLDNTLRLANNLIIWAHSQMQASPPEFAQVHVSILIEKIANTYVDIAQQKQIDLRTDVPQDLSIYVDANQMEFVLRNLVNNAIKFTPRHGCIVISALENENSVILKIQDTGQGMTIEKLETLFKVDKINQSQGTEGEKGTGMGLVLCYEFIRKNNGKITVESQVDKGSIFSIHLPKYAYIDEKIGNVVSATNLTAKKS